VFTKVTIFNATLASIETIGAEFTGIVPISSQCGTLHTYTRQSLPAVTTVSASARARQLISDALCAMIPAAPTLANAPVGYNAIN
jgi:hypothetical protein